MDNEWYEGRHWHKHKNGYWVSKVHGYQHVYVWEQAHQATVDSPDDVIHHINEDKEDNRIENLKLMTREEHTRLHASGREFTEATRLKMSEAQRGKKLSATTRLRISASKIGFQHSLNSKKHLSSVMAKKALRTSNTSGYKGVSWDKSRGKWMSKIEANKKYIYLGRFDSPEEAARAYDSAVRKYFGDDCFLNFPAKINADNKEAV